MISCRVCEGQRLFRYLSLGKMPLANRFLRAEELTLGEEFYPLEVYLCEDCGLSQLAEMVPPEVLFREYIYVTSTSDLAIRHARWLADSIVHRFSLTSQDLIVEVGSNDGCVLKAFKELGVETLGIEPARNVAVMARADGIDTLCEFFNAGVAESIRKSRGSAQVIIGRHVLAHVDALHNFVRGFTLLMGEDGVVIIEVPYLVDLLEKTEYDTIYHEHLSYFSLRVLSKLFGLFGMEIFDVQRVGIHGGSIIVYVQRSGGRNIREPVVEELLQKEEVLRLDAREPYLEFAQRVKESRERLKEALCELKSAGKKIMGYGAAAKGNVLLNYCGIDTEIVDCLLDKSPLKHNLYTPGTHIPVYPVEKLADDRPDYVLILAWNFASEIMEQLAEYRNEGGNFIIPIPQVHVV